MQNLKITRKPENSRKGGVVSIEPAAHLTEQMIIDGLSQFGKIDQCGFEGESSWCVAYAFFSTKDGAIHAAQAGRVVLGGRTVSIQFEGASEEEIEDVFYEQTDSGGEYYRFGAFFDDENEQEEEYYDSSESARSKENGSHKKKSGESEMSPIKYVKDSSSSSDSSNAKRKKHPSSNKSSKKAKSKNKTSSSIRQAKIKKKERPAKNRWSF